MKFSSVQEYFNWLYKLERFTMKYDLSNITALCNALGNPHKKFRSIHIAGTNGKGATASFISSILSELGLKAGLFTSPHILNFNERIRINGNCISNQYITDFLDNNYSLIKKIKPSFFEVNTAMAFKYFADKKVDAAVIECGLGGRLDSTNIINPDATVITQIDLDHMQWLGNTLFKIANEKLGIIKPGVKVIVSDNNKSLKKLFIKKIGIKNLIYLNDIKPVKLLQIRNSNLIFDYLQSEDKTIKLTAPLPAEYQSINAAAAIKAAEVFLAKNEINLSSTAVKRGIMNIKINTGYFGRMEFTEHNDKRFVLDVSHNPHGIKNAVKAIKKSGFKPDAVIFGLMEDKDHTASLKELLLLSRNYIFTKPDYNRSLEPGVLYTAAKKIKPGLNYMLDENLSGAIKIAEKTGYKNIAVMGSFFMVSDALKAMGFKKLPGKFTP
ncbi:MAG: FolC bifunctional protein [Chlorobi bacterium OLB5]|nr:MAG: FolC bifunctional protein [Chlorobi bacterium OLB5]